jgi:predicted transcriptional regulator
MPDPKSPKSAALELVQRLDDSATFDDILYELHVLQKIEQGRQAAEEGRTKGHDEVRDQLDQWLTRPGQ